MWKRTACGVSSVTLVLRTAPGLAQSRSLIGGGGGGGGELMSYYSSLYIVHGDNQVSTVTCMVKMDE